jgi:hypothetical protein
MTTTTATTTTTTDGEGEPKFEAARCWLVLVESGAGAAPTVDDLHSCGCDEKGGGARGVPYVRQCVRASLHRDSGAGCCWHWHPPIYRATEVARQDRACTAAALHDAVASHVRCLHGQIICTDRYVWS